MKTNKTIGKIKTWWADVETWRNHCREWLSVGNRTNWCVFAFMAVLFFVQTLVFDHFAFREFAVYTSTQNGFALIFSKIAASVLFASLTFILRNKRWLILLSVIVDVWLVANLIYMRNNHIVLDAEAFNMSSNLHGYFWSVLIYVEWRIDIIFFALTALLAFLLFFFVPKHTKRSWKPWLIVIVASIALRLGAEGLFVNAQKKQNVESRYDVLPFIREHREPVYGIHFPMAVANTSILYSPFYILTDYYLMLNDIQPDRPLTAQDSVMMAKLDKGPEATDTMDSPLIIVLLESLEDWVVTPEIMPNLYRLTQNDHVFYANRIHTQIVGAPSADGQMIVNTGLLPINAGATCMHYDDNTYPGIMSLSPDTAILLLPHDKSVWNQTKMSPAFGYDSTICYCDIDTILFQKLDSLVDNGYRYIQCITQSTHAPFWNEKYSDLELPSMNWVMHNFIRGFNSLDDGLGYFIRKIESDPKLQNYTIVFTGDHRILHYEKRDLMQNFADDFKGKDGKYAWIGELTPEDDCLPLIIYSPKISGNPRYTEDAYQMDIYPTYQSLVGVENYRWHGFGINLMDSTQKRVITPEDAFLLSDKVIRNNYFNH